MGLRKIKVGILTFSDGRKYIHDSLVELNQRYQDRLAAALEFTGFIDVVAGREIIWTPGGARSEGKWLQENGVDVTIFNYAIWAFPHLSAIATTFAPGPYLLFSNLHPSEPGMVAMLSSAGTMDQLGLTYTRVWGDIQNPATLEKVVKYIRAAGAISHIKGETYGLFGGRPLGMYTAVANLDQWQSLFGVDIEHIEQYDVVRYSEKFDSTRIDSGFKWLESHVGSIKYDGHALTPEKLKKQIASYHAVRQIMEEKDLDFVGFKAHGDLTDYFVTMDIAEAFLNDPYDWEGSHEPIVASTEADMDGALTMELLKHVSNGSPTLFADIRHYDADDDVWYFANSGTHATYFAARSMDPAQNLKKVTFYPEIPDFPAGGASVQYYAGAGPMTMARLARKKGQYWLAIVPAEFIEFSQDKMVAKSKTTDIEWPHAFARLKVQPEAFLSTYPCNHIHGIVGDWVDELCHIAEILGIDFKVYA
ncbi:MAG: L-fucose/L-arabinose isomerase family protein [Anaerolineaceae bacterium]|nr:L-fucose/L-arabinose isomerase family protein [Anaerolineaceae bacterium]